MMIISAHHLTVASRKRACIAIDNSVPLLFSEACAFPCKCDYCMLESDQPGFMIVDQ
jgi:hypothetical protein